MIFFVLSIKIIKVVCFVFKIIFIVCILLVYGKLMEWYINISKYVIKIFYLFLILKRVGVCIFF